MEKSITKLFLTKNKLRFSEIEKALKTRSNKLNYHLKKLIQKNILKKDGEFYFLSTESIIPYLSDKNAILPVVLIKIGDNKKCFLYERKKRPYENKLSLPGGRILVGEEISQAVKRIMKEKYNVDARLENINSISLEHVQKNREIIHSFLLIFVSATTKDKINLTKIDENKKRIIQSDCQLIKKNSNKEYELKTIKSKIK